MDDAVFATFDECEPQYSQIPFFSGALKSIIAVGTFVTVNGGIYRIVSYDTKQKTLSLNSFIDFTGSEITHVPIFSGAGREHVEVVQTLNGITVCLLVYWVLSYSFYDPRICLLASMSVVMEWRTFTLFVSETMEKVFPSHSSPSPMTLPTTQ